MRTKTLILSAVAGLVACVAAKADTNVYSLNAVGYINVTCPPGFTMIANQLNNITNGVADNSLATLIPNVQYGVDGDGNPLGTMDGIVVFKYNGSYVNETGDATSPGGWSGGGLLTFNPGEAGWFKNNRSTNIVLTFFGEVVQGTQTNTLVGNGGGTPKFTMASSIVPQAGGLDTTLGLDNTVTGVDGDGNPVGLLDGDVCFVWTAGPGGGYVSSTADATTPGGWAPAEPQLNVGQGFFYRTRTTRSWVRTFSANN